MNYEPQIFELEKSSVWSFKERGDWATHDSNIEVIVRHMFLEI